MKRAMTQGGIAATALLCLAGCAGGSSAASQPTVTTSAATATSSASATTTSASSGDIAACKAYLRVEPGANQSLKEGFEGLPAPVIAAFFTRWADGLEPGLGTATDPALVSALKGTIGGLRSGAATANAWSDGNLDLIPDLTVVYEQSEKAAEVCSKADLDGTYIAIVNAG